MVVYMAKNVYFDTVREIKLTTVLPVDLEF